MAYDPVAQSGSWHPTGGIQYDESGRAYQTRSDTGARIYTSPFADPRLSLEQAKASKGEGGGFVHGNPQWDTEKGEWKRPINWGNIAALGVGGAIAAPFIAPALGALGSGGATSTASSALIPGGTAPAVSGIGGSSMFGSLFGGFGLDDALGLGGKIASGFAKGSADERTGKLDAATERDRMQLAGAQNQRTSETDILKKLAQAGYLKSGGSTYAPPAGAGSFGFGPKGSSPEQQQAATTLQQELLARLQNPLEVGGDYDALARPGLMERISGPAGLGLSALAGLRR